jgi:hypothetical protein
MAAKLIRLTHKIAIQLYLMAESCTICSSRSRRPVRKLLDTFSYLCTPSKYQPLSSLWPLSFGLSVVIHNYLQPVTRWEWIKSRRILGWMTPNRISNWLLSTFRAHGIVPASIRCVIESNPASHLYLRRRAFIAKTRVLYQENNFRSSYELSMSRHSSVA